MPTDPSFHMLVDDVFSIAGRGTVVTGKVEAGTIRAGDEVLVRGGGRDLKATVAGIEAFRKMLPAAQAGDAIGLLLKGVSRAQVERGFEILSPDLAG